MTTKLKEAIIALAKAIESECNRGHIPDETGSLVCAASDLAEAVKEEPTTDAPKFEGVAGV